MIASTYNSVVQLVVTKFAGDKLPSKEDFLADRQERYRLFCEKVEYMPLYSQPWWLDIVCGKKNWDVVFVESNEEIIGTLTFQIKKKYGFTIISNPKFSPFSGIWIRPASNKRDVSKASYLYEVSNKLIEQLPKVSYYSQGLHYSFTNWLPFYWKGYMQTTYYSYVINDISNVEKVFANFDKSKRNNIRKARGVVEVKDNMSAETFYNFHKDCLGKDKKGVSYSLDMFKNMFDAVQKKNCGKCLYAMDKDEHIHSALFFVWDKESAYTLISAVDPVYQSSYSLSLLMYEAIVRASSLVKRFDFEGSMIKSVEKSYRYFGGDQMPYLVVSKVPSLIIRTALFLKEFIRN